ncbi:MAG: YqeG family HAD IIIA-type phosphatase [Clostridia bacterium]|nr:YqeG family HAD IIIA-type phosphatase [Clostridia bacterium]
MLKRFYPAYIYKSVADIEDDFFKKHNIKNVLLDIDNTLVPYTLEKPNEFAISFINRLKKEGLNICLVSNNSKSRVTLFNSDLGLNVRYRASKPLTHAIRSAMKSMGAKPSETAIIGDQLFTDIYSGNRMKLTTVLVEPLEAKESRFFQLKRHMEKKILSIMNNK